MGLLSANYINSPGNCLQPSGYYLVCCHNECDDILGRLEKQLGQPSATPMEIVTALRATSGSSCAPWQNEEELFAPILHAPLHELENDPHVWNVAGGIAILAALSTFAISLTRTCKSVTKSKHQRKMLQI